MLKNIIQKCFGTKTARDIKKMQPVVQRVNEIEESCQKLDDRAIALKRDEFRKRLEQGEPLDSMLPEAFALVREAARRTLNMRHFDVQIMGGIVLHQGKIAEMATGEGKTLVDTLPVYLNSLTGGGVYLVTVNDYLAKRDSQWMGPIYEMLGLSVGLIQHDMNAKQRRDAYRCDVTYVTNNELGFDYLRDNMAHSLDEFLTALASIIFCCRNGQFALRLFRIFIASGSLTSVCLGTASTTPVRGLIHNECALPSLFK